MKNKNPQKQNGLNALQKCVANIDKMPTPLLVQSLNSTIKLLAKRGVEIRDWDDRGKVVHSFKCLGSSVFLLAPRDSPGTEGDADGKSGKPGSE